MSLSTIKTLRSYGIVALLVFASILVPVASAQDVPPAEEICAPAEAGGNCLSEAIAFAEETVDQVETVVDETTAGPLAFTMDEARYLICMAMESTVVADGGEPDYSSCINPLAPLPPALIACALNVVDVDANPDDPSVTPNLDACADVRAFIDSIRSSGPVMDSVKLTSNNADPELAKEDDIVTLAIVATDDFTLESVDFTVDGVTTTFTPEAGEETASSFDVEYVVPAGLDGDVDFVISWAEGEDVTKTTDGSAVTVDTTAPDGTITFAHEDAGVSTPRWGDTTLNVVFTTADMLNGDGSYTFANSAPVTFTPADDAVDIPIQRGLLTVTMPLIDAAGNTFTLVDSVQVVPLLDGNMALTEGGLTADGQTRYFADEMARTYTVTLTHEGAGEPVGRLVMDFTGSDLLLLDISDPDAVVFTNNADTITSVEIDPFVVDGETKTLTFTVAGNGLLDGDEAEITITSQTASTAFLDSVTTTFVADHVGPDAASWEFLADENGDMLITREEYFAANEEIVLEVTDLIDAGSGPVRVELTLGEEVLASADVTDATEPILLTIALADMVPGWNDFTLYVIDGVGNIGADEPVYVEIAIVQRIVIEPGALYLQPGEHGFLFFEIDQEDVVDNVVRYDLRAKRTTETSDFIVTGFGDGANAPQVGSTAGTVRLVRYANPADSLSVFAAVTLTDEAADGDENYFDLIPLYDPANADIEIVDRDNMPYGGPVGRVVIDGTAPVLNGFTVSDYRIEASEMNDLVTVSFDITELNPYTVIIRDENGVLVDATDGSDAFMDVSTLAAGTYTYTIEVEDDAGNAAAIQEFDLVIVSTGTITVDALTQDTVTPGDGLLFDEVGTLWSIDVVGNAIPSDTEGCPCTIELDILRDDAVEATLTEAIVDLQTVTFEYSLTGAADGTYTAAASLMSSAGELLAEASDMATITIQPRITGFTAEMGGMDVTGTTMPSAGAESVGILASFVLDSGRADLSSAEIVSALGYSSSTNGYLSASQGLVIPISATGAASSFTLDLDNTNTAPHDGVESFAVQFTGTNDLTVLVDEIPTSFAFAFDKAVDALTVNPVQTTFGQFTFNVDAADIGFGIDTIDLYIDGAFVDGALVNAATFDGSFVAALAEGTHDYEVIATDLGGNEATATGTVEINDDAVVLVSVLDGTKDTLADGRLIVDKGAWKDVVLSVTNGNDEPTISTVTLSLTGGTSAIVSATGWDLAHTTSGGSFDELTFDIEVPAGQTVERLFSVRADATSISGTWAVTAFTADGFQVSAPNAGLNTFLIETPATVTPVLDAAVTQNGDALMDNAGTFYATADQPELGDLDSMDEVTFDVTITDGTDAIVGATVGLFDMEATTNDMGVATFTVDPDAYDLDFSIESLEFSVAEQQAMINGVPVDLNAKAMSLDIVWTGFFVDVTGDDRAPATPAALGETTLDASVYWLHEVMDANGDIDVSGVTPVSLGVGATLNLVEEAGAGLTADQTGLDAAPFDVARGDNTFTAVADAGAGYRRYTAELGGDLPMGVAPVYATTEHEVLFTAVRLVFDNVESISFDKNNVALHGEWLHTTDFDGNAIDVADLGTDVLTVTSTGGAVTAAGNSFSEELTLAAGKTLVTYTGAMAGLDVYPASTELLKLSAGWASEPLDGTLTVGADYLGDFSVLVNGDDVDDAFDVDDYTLTTSETGVDATSISFVGNAIDLSAVSLALGSDTIDVTGTYGTAWDFTVPAAEAGAYTLAYDLVLGSANGVDYSQTIQTTFVITQTLFQVTIDSATGTDATDLSSIWADRTDVAGVDLMVDVVEGAWNGATLGSPVAADGALVELFTSADGILWTSEGSALVSAGQATLNVPTLANDDAGVTMARLVVVDDGTQALPAVNGLNAHTLEAETEVIFTGITAAFTGSGDRFAKAGDDLVFGLSATYDHDGSAVEGLGLTVTGTGLTTVDTATDALGVAFATFDSATPMAVADLDVSGTTMPHGLSAVSSAYTGDLHWVVVKVQSIGFKTSSDGKTFTDAVASGNVLDVPANTYVKVASQVVLDDGTTEFPAEGGLVKYGKRSVGLSADGVGTRTYFSSQANSLGPMAVSNVSAAISGQSFTGGDGSAFTINWV